MQVKKMICLNSIDGVKEFVTKVSKYEFDMDLVHGRYVVDAKSIMGVFSLDLSKPIEFRINAETNMQADVERLLAELKDIIV